MDGVDMYFLKKVPINKWKSNRPFIFSQLHTTRFSNYNFLVTRSYLNRFSFCRSVCLSVCLSRVCMLYIFTLETSCRWLNVIQNSANHPHQQFDGLLPMNGILKFFECYTKIYSICSNFRKNICKV